MPDTYVGSPREEWDGVLTAAHSRGARAGLNWSVRDLAREAKVSTNTIVRLERGNTIGHRTASSIAAAFERGGIELLGRDGRIGMRFAMSAEKSQPACGGKEPLSTALRNPSIGHLVPPPPHAGFSWTRDFVDFPEEETPAPKPVSISSPSVKQVFVQHLCDMAMKAAGYEPGYIDASGAKLYWPPKGKLQQARILVDRYDAEHRECLFAHAQVLVDAALMEVRE